MNKIITALFVLCIGTANAATNPMFDAGDENTIRAYTAQGVGGGHLGHLVWPGFWDVSPQTMIMAEYSQPMTLLRMPARVNVSAIQNIAYESNSGLSFIGGGISWDIAPISWHQFYAGVGIGPYYRNNMDRYVSSRLVFGPKFFIGMRIAEHTRVEFFTLHFSNGDTTPVNHGFNFAGINIGYGF